MASEGKLAQSIKHTHNNYPVKANCVSNEHPEIFSDKNGAMWLHA